jgi:hypothetical protein
MVDADEEDVLHDWTAVSYELQVDGGQNVQAAVADD